MKKVFTLLFCFMSGYLLQAQSPVLVEHFNYQAGTNLQNNGWTGHSAATTNPIKVSDGGLSWSQTPYLGSGVGNAAAVSNTGADENKPFNSWVKSGNVYAGFLMRVNGVVNTANQGYFFHMGEYADTITPVYTAVSTAFRARTYVVPGSTADKFRVGITLNSSTAPATTGVDVSSDLDTGATYLVIVKYQFVDGAQNDSASLYVFKDGDDISSEPAKATAGPVSFSGTGTFVDVSFLQHVALRQFNAAQRITVDGIIVRTNWEWKPAVINPVAPSLISPPNNVSVRVTGPANTPVVINWTAAQNMKGSVLYQWQAAPRATGSFTPPALALASDNSGADTALSLNFGAIDNTLAGLGLAPGDTLKAVWRVRAISGSDTLYSNSFNIDLIRGYLVAPLSTFDLLTPANDTKLTVAPGQTQIASITWRKSAAGTLPVTYQWLAVAKGGNINTPAVTLPSDNSGKDSALTVTLGALDNLLAGLGVKPGDSIELQWTVKASADTQKLNANQIWNITLKRNNDNPGSANLLNNNKLEIFPNPANTQVMIQLNETLTGTLNIRISDQLGRVITEQTEPAQNSFNLSVGDLKNGIYWIQINNGTQQFNQRLIIQH